MREIKFRGKRIDNSEWVHGNLIIHNESTYIVYPNPIAFNSAVREEVIPESVGQYTGFKDKNGVEIYEGCTVKYRIEDKAEPEGYYDWIAEVKMVCGYWVACEIGFDYSNTPIEDYTKLHEDHELLEIIGDTHNQLTEV